MSDLTPWLLAVGAALILAGGGIGVWLLPRRDTPSTDLVAMFDDATAVLPAVTWWEPWVDGWGVDGWCPLAELSRIEREVAGPVPPLLFDALHVEWASRLAIESGSRLELEGAPA